MQYYKSSLNDQFIFDCQKDELAAIPIFTRYKISSTYQSVIDVLILAYFFFVQVNIGKWRKTTSNHKRRVRILKYILITCVIE